VQRGNGPFTMIVKSSLSGPRDVTGAAFRMRLPAGALVFA